MLRNPFLIYSGWKIGFFLNKTTKDIRLIYFIPLFSAVILTVSGGGRAYIIEAGLFFMLGLLFSLFSSNHIPFIKSKLKIISKYILIFILFFGLYATFVSDARSKYGQGLENSRYITAFNNSYPFLKPVSGLFEYFVFHFQGYQFRREDSEFHEIKYGQSTFAFLTHFNVPIISQLLGVNISLQNLFGLEYVDPVKNTVDALNNSIQAHSITPTVFYILVQDFGFYGTFISIFLFVGLTQYLYDNLFLKYNKSFWSIILFVAIYKLWTLTFFSHHLLGAWMNSLIYPLIIIDLLNKIVKNR
jgi:hypothetical protein